MIPATVALAVLIVWFIGLQAMWVGRNRMVPGPQAVRVTTAVLSGGTALLVVPRLHARDLLVGPDDTAVALSASIVWLVGLQALRVGRDSPDLPDSPVPSSWAIRMTSVVLSAGVVLLVVPDLYHLLVA
jgi:hypothetical protein